MPLFENESSGKIYHEKMKFQRRFKATYSDSFHKTMSTMYIDI